MNVSRNDAHATKGPWSPLAVALRNIERAGLENVDEIRHGRALDVLPQLKADGQGPFALIFIDADKPPLAE